ncbi:hypothetical protein D5086_004094 [Populus alba]|uniref:Uncharacterized protein n=1 Tax=Populus alba TaxID=43335 RepID=A0ACC4CPC7_POPAL
MIPKQSITVLGKPFRNSSGLLNSSGTWTPRTAVTGGAWAPKIRQREGAVMLPPLFDQSVGFFFSSASGWQIGCVGVSRSTAAQLLAEEAPLVCGCCSVPAGLELAAVGKETEGVKAAGSLVMAAPLFWPLLLEAEWRGTVRGSEKQRKRRAVAAVLIAAGEPNGGDREVGRRSEVGCSFRCWKMCSGRWVFGRAVLMNGEEALVRNRL